MLHWQKQTIWFPYFLVLFLIMNFLCLPPRLDLQGLLIHRKGQQKRGEHWHIMAQFPRPAHGCNLGYEPSCSSPESTQKVWRCHDAIHLSGLNPWYQEMDSSWPPWGQPYKLSFLKVTFISSNQRRSQVLELSRYDPSSMAWVQRCCKPRPPNLPSKPLSQHLLSRPKRSLLVSQKWQIGFIASANSKLLRLDFVSERFSGLFWSQQHVCNPLAVSAMETGKEAPMVLHRTVILKRILVTFTVQLYASREHMNLWWLTTITSRALRSQESEQGLSEKGIWEWHAAWDLVLVVEEDQPRWGRRWEAWVPLEQPQALGFLGRDLKEGSCLQMGHQSKF